MFREEKEDPDEYLLDKMSGIATLGGPVDFLDEYSIPEELRNLEEISGMPDTSSKSLSYQDAAIKSPAVNILNLM